MFLCEKGDYFLIFDSRIMETCMGMPTISTGHTLNFISCRHKESRAVHIHAESVQYLAMGLNHFLIKKVHTSIDAGTAHTNAIHAVICELSIM